MKSIGKYEIRAILGRGAMGVVYKVIIPGIHKIAAVKALSPSPKLIEKMGMAQLRRRFVQEAAVSANLRHPNLVDIFSLEEENDRLFYVMEYLSHNLGTFIGEAYWADAPTRVVPAAKAARLIMEILGGLQRLHDAGIIHRDLKPFNIMLTDQGRVKIVDFGLSKKRGETGVENADLFIGTKFYAAPEQIAGPEAVDLRADLYSTGVMLYRLLTGLLPQTPPQTPSRLNPDLDRAWDELLLKAVSSRPEDRFQEARTMRMEIEQVLADYQNQKNKACVLADDSAVSSAGQPSLEPGTPLRSRPDRVLAKHAKTVFDINDLHRPKTYCLNRLETTQPDLVIDHTTALVWQGGGSAYPLPWQQAFEYIDKLNEIRLGGFNHWRLPTVNELLTLLNPPPPGEDFCLKSPFSPDQQWIWSGDSRSHLAAWFVNMEMGFVASADVLDSLYVKGVCVWNS